MQRQLTPDQNQQLIDLAKSQIALCLEQMDSLFMRFKQGKISRTDYSAKLRIWEDRYFEQEFKLRELEQ